MCTFLGEKIILNKILQEEDKKGFVFMLND